MVFKYGFSFYPEHCSSADDLVRDYSLIADSGANIVRIGEFAWDKLEPADGNFNFGWLDDVICELGKRGVMTVLCTPTACPPIWLCRDHDIAYVNNFGREKPFGARRHYCPTKPDMLFYSKRIVSAMAEHFGCNPNVYGWQIDNELGHNGSSRCRCESCAKKFRLQLRKKFNNDISALNSAFGTCFWAGRYQNFEQINLPVGNIEKGSSQTIYPSFYENPSMRLEFEKFSSEMITEFMNMQIDTIRKYSKKPITTNSTGLSSNSIDYYRLYKNADFYGIDSYPPMYQGNDDYCSVNFSHARSCKDKDSFWVMEFTAGGGHTTSGGGRIQPYPGAIEQNVVYAYAAGAELLMHFQYKAFLSGAEQLNYSILDADRVPRRRYFEFQRTAKTLKRLEDILGNSVHKKSRAAIVFNYSDLWAVEIKPLSAEQKYAPCVKEIFSVMNELNIAPEIISVDAELSDFDLLIVPLAVTMPKAFKAKLKDFVKNGGTAVSTVGCAIKDKNNLGIPDTYPCGLTELFGIEVQECEPILENVNDKNISIGGSVIPAKRWLEELKCTSAEPVARFEGGYRHGKCAISRNNYGKGHAYYLGTFLERDGMKKLIRAIAAKAGIYPDFPPSAGTDIQVKTDDTGKKYIFVFNYTVNPVTATLDGTYSDVLNNAKYTGSVTLNPKGYLCLTPENPV